MNERVEIDKMSVKSQEIKSRDLDSVKNVPNTVPINPTNIYQKLALNGLECNLNQA